MKVAVYQMGGFWEEAYETKVFENIATAKTCIPPGYVEKQSSDSTQFYAENPILERWLTITEYEVQNPLCVSASLRETSFLSLTHSSKEPP